MTPSSMTSHRRVPLGQWPQIDRERWLAAQQAVDPLDPSIGLASRWKASTRNMIETGYGWWLGYLECTAQLDPALDPGDRASPPRIKDYLAILQAAGLAPYTVSGRMQQLGNALRTIAPDHDWSKILRAASRIHARATPVREKRKNMRPPEEILLLASAMMHAAENDSFRTGRERASLFRDGLILGLLVYRAPRAANLTEILIGSHLVCRGDTWWLCFHEGKSASAAPWECPWPEELAVALERYLDVHRNVLLKSAHRGRKPTQALWISKRGTDMTQAAIDAQVRSRTKEKFGLAINLHRFRHIAATTIATDAPEHVGDIQGALWHSSMHPSEKYYNLAGQLDAGRRYNAVLEARRIGK